MRDIRELLILIKKEFPKVCGNNPHDQQRVIGLCEMTLHISPIYLELTADEIDIIDDYFVDNIPEFTEDKLGVSYYGYHWKAGDTKSRIEWLDEQIEKLNE